MKLSGNDVFVVEYPAGGGELSRLPLSDYAPHFYRLENQDGDTLLLVSPDDLNQALDQMLKELEDVSFFNEMPGPANAARRRVRQIIRFGINSLDGE